METGERQEVSNANCESDSDDSILKTISQMQNEAAKLQTTAAEIREELSGLLATLDVIEHRSTTEKLKKIRAKPHPESGDAIAEELLTLEPEPPVALTAVQEGMEPSESDDRYRDVPTTPTKPPRHGSRGDMTLGAVGEFKPSDARELLNSVLDAVMERQSGAGDSLDAHPELPATCKDDGQGAPKSCVGIEGQHTIGDIDASTQSSDSDDHDVVVSPARSSWEAVERRRMRRPRKPGSEGSISSDARSSSTADDVFHDTVAVEHAGGDMEYVDGLECPY